MIVRVWRAVATRQKAPAYRAHLEQSVLPQLRALPGFLGITLLKAERGDRVEMVVTSRWTSMEAIRAFAGSVPERAVVEPAARAVLVEFDDFVSHYEVALEAGPDGAARP
jgi:heme-degrading monooxygenase HmoA